MALGFKERREAEPLHKAGKMMHDNGRSYRALLDGFVTAVWLPKSQVEFHMDHVDDKNTPHGTFVIPAWLARKEGLDA